MQDTKSYILRQICNRLIVVGVAAVLMCVGALRLYAADANKRSQLASKYTPEHPLVILADNDFAPYEFCDDSGEPSGYNIEVLSMLLDDMGISYEFRMATWDDVFEQFSSRKGDMLLCPNIMALSHTYVGKSVVVRYNVAVAYKKGTRPLTKADLSGMDSTKVGFKKMDYAPSYLATDSIRKHFRPTVFCTPRQGIKSIIRNKLDYYIYSEKVLQQLVSNMAESDLVHIADFDIPAAEVTFVGYDRELVNELDTRFHDMMQDGSFDMVNTKWFSPLEYKKQSMWLYWQYIAELIAAIGVLIFIVWIMRRQVKRALRQCAANENILQKALHTNDNYIISNDLKTEKMENIHGDFFEDDNIKSDKFFEMFHPEDIDKLLAKRLAMVGGNATISNIYRIKRNPADEDWRSYIMSSIIETDKKGRQRKIITTITDITDEARREQFEQSMSDMYGQIFNIPLIGIAVYSSDGYLQRANRRMMEIFRFTDPADEYYFSTCLFDMDPMIGNISADNLYDFAVCHKFNIPQRDVYDHVEITVCPVRRAEGQVISIFVMAHMLNDERKLYRESLDKERKEKERKEELQHYERDLRVMLNTTNTRVWQTFPKERLIKIYDGYSTVSVTIGFDMLLNLMNTDEERNNLLNVIEPPQNIVADYSNLTVKVPLNILTGEKKVTWYALTYIPNVENGVVCGSFGLASNTTSDMEHEEHLKRETKRTMEIGLRKNEFLANMTHEIRTPLNAIMGFCDVFSITENREERAEYVRIINKNCELLDKLISNLLEISAIDAGADANVHVVTDVDFVSFFNEACKKLKVIVAGTPLEFITDNPCKKLDVKIDTKVVELVLTNFVDNAVKYTTEGHVKVGYRLEENYIYVYCEDTGLGIPKDKQEIVFERFMKLNDFVQGTGIGLSICKALVERMGGIIGLDSEGDGKGSTFWFRMPWGGDYSPILRGQLR